MTDQGSINQRAAWFQIHLATLLFGGAGLFGKFLDLPSIWIVLGRAGFAALALFIVIKLTRISPNLKSWRDLLVMAILGGILAVHWWSFFFAIQISTVAIGLLSFSTFPLFVTFLEPIFFRERLTATSIITAIITCLGLVLVVPTFSLENQLTQGALWGVVSGLTFAIMSLLNRQYVQSYPGAVIALYQNGFAALCLLPFVAVLQTSPSGQDWAMLLLLGVMFTALAHTLFIRSMRTIKAQQASIIISLEPVYGILLAALLLSEIPTVRMLIGGGLILGAAIYIMQRGNAS